MKSHELMEALTEHARELGWNLIEYSSKDSGDDSEMYEIWLEPIEAEGASS